MQRNANCVAFNFENGWSTSFRVENDGSFVMAAFTISEGRTVAMRFGLEGNFEIKCENDDDILHYMLAIASYKGPLKDPVLVPARELIRATLLDVLCGQDDERPN